MAWQTVNNSDYKIAKYFSKIARELTIKFDGVRLALLQGKGRTKPPQRSLRACLSADRERSNLRTVQIREREFVEARPAKKFCSIECPM